MFTIVTAPPVTQEKPSCLPVGLILTFILSDIITHLSHSATCSYNTWYIFKSIIMSHSISPNGNNWFAPEILQSNWLRAHFQMVCEWSDLTCFGFKPCKPISHIASSWDKMQITQLPLQQNSQLYILVHFHQSVLLSFIMAGLISRQQSWSN